MLKMLLLVNSIVNSQNLGRRRGSIGRALASGGLSTRLAGSITRLARPGYPRVCGRKNEPCSLQAKSPQDFYTDRGWCLCEQFGKFLLVYKYSVSKRGAYE